MEIGDVVFGRPILPYSANKNVCNAKTYDVILMLAQKSSRLNELKPLMDPRSSVHIFFTIQP
jgi:hypothetical protein